MKKLLFILMVGGLFMGCATINDIGFIDTKSTAFFKIGMTEEEFIRKNPSITEKNDDDEFPIYIESCKGKYKYIICSKNE